MARLVRSSHERWDGVGYPDGLLGLQLYSVRRERAQDVPGTLRRVRELGSRTSLLAPVWYAGSFAIGVLAGISGDRTSLGFVEETEKVRPSYLRQE